MALQLLLLLPLPPRCFCCLIGAFAGCATAVLFLTVPQRCFCWLRQLLTWKGPSAVSLAAGQVLGVELDARHCEQRLVQGTVSSQFGSRSGAQAPQDRTVQRPRASTLSNLPAPVAVRYPSTAKVWQTLNIGKSSRIPNNLIISGAVHVHGQMPGHCLGVVCQTLPVLRY